VGDGIEQVLDDAAYRAAAERVSDEIRGVPEPAGVAEVISDRFGALPEG